MACAVWCFTKPPKPRTQRVQHPATAGERAGLRRPVHPREDEQLPARFKHQPTSIATKAKSRVSCAPGLPYRLKMPAR
jgi:hypothetical protein